MNLLEPKLDLAEGLERLRASLAEHGGTPPHPLPTHLKRNQIASMVAVFQPRTLEGRLAEDEVHLKELSAAIGDPANPKQLDPVTVWWGGDRWYVIDGHHRLIAYQRVGVSSGIPVVVFEGSLEDAMLRSAALNSKNQLPMRQDDKLNYAWRLVLTTDLSKQKIVEACAVSNGTVGNMRKAKETLLNERQLTLEELYDKTWKQAQMDAKGITLEPLEDPLDAARKRGERYARSLCKAIGDRSHRDPEGFAWALVILDDRLPGSLMQTEAWSEHFENTVRDLRDEFEEADELAAHWDAEEDY